MKKFIKFIIPVALMAFSACANEDLAQVKSDNTNTDDDSVQTEQLNTVEVSDFTFIPDTLTIKAGESVTWAHDDKVTHIINFIDFKSDNMERGDSFTHTFDSVGTYEYNCSIHPAMRGEIIVE